MWVQIVKEMLYPCVFFDEKFYPVFRTRELKLRGIGFWLLKAQRLKLRKFMTTFLPRKRIFMEKIIPISCMISRKPSSSL